MAFLGGLHYWWPKIFGRMYSEKWGRVSVILIFIGFNLTFFSQFIMGAQGHAPPVLQLPSRSYAIYHRISTAGAFVMASGFVIMAVYLIDSLIRGRKAPANPWGGNTMEWKCASPPPHDNFAVTPEVQDPYDFSRLVHDDVSGGWKETGACSRSRGETS